jgi:hypothetical protein
MEGAQVGWLSSPYLDICPARRNCFSTKALFTFFLREKCSRAVDTHLDNY